MTNKIELDAIIEKTRELIKGNRKEIWFVYFLRCRDGSLYCGTTNDPLKRLAAHNGGKGAKYTRGRLPVCMVYCRRFDGRSAACKEEYRLKQLSKKEKEAIIKSDKK